MLLFLLVFNLFEINAINTKCKRFYKCPPQSSFYKSFYEFVPGPDFSKLGGEEQNHVDQFTCGKYCIDIDKGDTCNCGGEIVHRQSPLHLSHGNYCCNPRSCSINSKLGVKTVTCPNASLLSLSQKCEDVCPALTRGFSNFALSSKCDTNDTCLKDFDANKRHAKVCHIQNQNLTNFFETFCPSSVGQACDPPFLSKIAYKQCFANIHGESYEQTFKCWSRTDQKDHLFNRTLTNQGVRLRVNLNSVLPKNDTHFDCANQSFRWDTACKGSDNQIFKRDTACKGPSICTLPNGFSLSMKSENQYTPTVCGDHSFWRPKCSNVLKQGDCTINPDFGKGSDPDFTCDLPDEFYCSKSSTCIKKSLTCNGLVDCFHGEDEAFEVCHNKSFVEAATIKCIESNRNGEDIEILAVPCNGIRECRDGSDEDNCATMLHFTIDTMMTCCAVAVTSWWYVFFLIKLKDKKRRIKITLPPNRKQLVKKRLTGNRLAKIKNTTDYTTCANIMEVCNNKDDESSSFRRSVKKIKDYVQRPKVYFILGPFHLIGANMDFIKDCILLYIIAKALGGPSTIFENYTIFSSVVWIMMLIIVVFPTVLAGARLAATPDLIFGPYAVKSTKHRIGFAIILLMLSPFLSLIIRLKKAYLDMLSRIEPENKATIKERDEMMTALAHHVKLELGLETVFQLFGSLLLLFNALSSTRTTDALNQVFNDINDNNKTISTFILVASACWSFKSCLKAHLYGLGYCREHFPLQTKVIAAIYAFFAGTKRILTFIMFFAPPLGLFNLLRHLQAEQIPFDKGLGGFVDNNGTLQLGSDEPFKWTEPFKTGKEPILDRWNGTDLAPHYILYSTYKLKHYFFAFLALLLVQFLVICVVKLCLSQGYRQLNGLEKVIHVMECSHIASTSQEWDACRGDAQEHIKWMKRNQNEGFALIAVNFAFGILFLLPFALFTYKIVERHEFLLNSIGVLEQEVQAYQDVQIWMGLSTLYLVLATIMEMVLFWLYNQKYHPFADILDVKEDEQEMKELRGEVEVGQSVFY